ncbi:MAG TPA: aminotransferase class I/II-fold pyridoxal phosphate-dependent enzyme, partial [Solirubrobacteraceae bacterium]
ELEPDLGVSEISQAGALESLNSCLEVLVKRVRRVAKERAELTDALRRREFDVSDSQANFLWVAHPALDGGELAARLARAGILVAAGDALGEPHHVRIAIRDEASSTRLLNAIDRALA